MRAVDAIMECLKAEGVEVVFGLPGGANLPTYDAFVDAGIRHVLVRHEAGGGHAAEGYAKATGKVGVAFATSGPGATNLVTPIVDAMMDSVPTVFITGQVRTDLHRHGRLPGDRHARHHDAGRQALLPDPLAAGDPARDPRGVPPRAQRAPGPGRRRHPGRPQPRGIPYEPVTDLHLPGYQPTTDGNTKQIRQAAKAMASARRPGDLRRRRRRQRQRVQGARRVRDLRPLPRDMHADGARRLPGPAPAVARACSACTARGRRTTRWTRPT